MTPEKVIVASHLVKIFKDFRAVDDISFEVEAGKIFGFLGPNGAGKTTTIKMMTTTLAPTEGTILLPVAAVFMFLIAMLFTAIGTIVGSVLEDMQAFPLIMNFLVMPMFFYRHRASAKYRNQNKAVTNR